MLRMMGCLALLSIFVGSALARRAETGFLNRQVSVDGETYRYQVYVPENWSPRQKWPVILFLHGAGERGSDGLLQTDVGLGHAIRMNPSRWPFVIVMPQCRRDMLWTDPAMQAQALAAVERSIKEFRGDRDHIYLTGLSMGGYGTWDLSAKYPGKFAALVVICGGIRGPEHFANLHVSLVDDGTVADPYAETARRVGKTPVWIFHGSADDAVPVDESRKMAEALRKLGSDFQYTEFAGVGHNAWDQAYSEPAITQWLIAARLHR